MGNSPKNAQELSQPLGGGTLASKLHDPEFGQVFAVLGYQRALADLSESFWSM